MSLTKELKLSYHDLHVITNALSVYRMYLYEDYDKEEDSFLKGKIYDTIIDTNRLMRGLLKLEGSYHDI